jgi:hypothetical protein
MSGMSDKGRTRVLAERFRHEARRLERGPSKAREADEDRGPSRLRKLTEKVRDLSTRQTPTR